MSQLSASDPSPPAVVAQMLPRSKRQLPELAVQVIHGCDYADVAVVDTSGRLQTVACSDPLLYRADTVQHARTMGPSLEAFRNGSCLVDDLATDPRWPGFSAWASARGLASILACDLAAGPTVLGVLNLYAIEPGAFTERVREQASTYATRAAGAIAAVADRSALSEELAGTRTIARAVDILVGRHGVTPERAFALVVQTSTGSNVTPPVLTEPCVQPLGDERTGFRLVGEVDLSNSDQLRQALERVLWTVGADVHLELAELRFLDVASARCLIRVASLLSARGNRLVLHGPPALARRLVEAVSRRRGVGDALVLTDDPPVGGLT